MPHVARRVQVRLDAPPDDVRECVDRLVSDTSDSVTTLEVDVGADGDGSTVTVSSRLALPVPYFGWFVRLLAWSGARRAVQDLAEGIRAEVEGTPPPPPRRPSRVLPAVRFTPAQAATL